MSAPTPDPAVPAEPAATVDPVTPEPAPEPTAEPKPTETVEFWKQKAREQENRAKSNADAARKLKEIEDRDLTELQRAQKAAEDSATELAALRRQNVLLAKGITVDLPSPTASADELAAFADQLLAWRGAAPTALPNQPRPDPGQGARPIDAKAQEDAEYTAYEQAFFKPTRS